MSSSQDQPGNATGIGATTDGTGMGATVGRHASQTADSAPRRAVPRPAPGYDDRPGLVESDASGAVMGWSVFASVMLMISGIGNLLEGIAQIVNGHPFGGGPPDTHN